MTDLSTRIKETAIFQAFFLSAVKRFKKAITFLIDLTGKRKKASKSSRFSLGLVQIINNDQPICYN